MDSNPETEVPRAETTKAFIAWMQANAVALEHVEAGHGFEDLHFYFCRKHNGQPPDRECATTGRSS